MFVLLIKVIICKWPILEGLDISPAGLVFLKKKIERTPLFCFQYFIRKAFSYFPSFEVYCKRSKIFQKNNRLQTRKIEMQN